MAIEIDNNYEIDNKKAILLNESLTKQDFLDLGFAESDYKSDYNWMFQKINNSDNNREDHKANYLIHYSTIYNRLSVTFAGEEHAKTQIVQAIDIKNKQELKWLFDRLKPNFLYLSPQ